jgi:hypothetical protein
MAYVLVWWFLVVEGFRVDCMFGAASLHAIEFVRGYTYARLTHSLTTHISRNKK